MDAIHFHVDLHVRRAARSFVCVGNAEQEATFDTTGCDIVLTGTTESHEKTEAGEGTETDATVSLACEGTNTIKITSAGCTMTMAPARPEPAKGAVNL